MPRIFEFFDLNFRFFSSREFGIIKDELIFAPVFLRYSRIRGKKKKINNDFKNYTQRINYNNFHPRKTITIFLFLTIKIVLLSKYFRTFAKFFIQQQHTIQWLKRNIFLLLAELLPH